MEFRMIRPIAAEARGEYRIWIQFTDGISGEVDLAHLAGRGVFAAWNGTVPFENVHVAAHGAIAWEDEIELCPDSLYLRLTGLSAADVMPGIRHMVTDA